jgi:hypothetical protein
MSFVVNHFMNSCMLRVRVATNNVSDATAIRNCPAELYKTGTDPHLSASDTFPIRNPQVFATRRWPIAPSLRHPPPGTSAFTHKSPLCEKRNVNLR